MFDLFGGRRIAPLWDTRRNMGTQFFTQEYEGRETDISLIPWASHRSLWSALFSLIKNPTPDEFKEWDEAGVPITMANGEAVTGGQIKKRKKAY